LKKSVKFGKIFRKKLLKDEKFGKFRQKSEDRAFQKAGFRVK